LIKDWIDSGKPIDNVKVPFLTVGFFNHRKLSSDIRSLCLDLLNLYNICLALHQGFVSAEVIQDVLKSGLEVFPG
jgi:hypothetical protein